MKPDQEPVTGTLAGGRSDLAVVCILYSLAHGLLLLNSGVFWDDWVVFGMRPDLIRTLYYEVGLPPGYFYHRIVDWVLGHRIVTFLSFLLASVALHQVLSRVRDLTRFERVSVVLVFALIPTASARISTVVAWYATCYALFFGAFWLMAAYLERRSIWLRLAALVLFVNSFFLQSLLVLYAIPLLYLLAWHRPEIRSAGAMWRLFLRYADFFLLALVFWVLKSLALRPYGFLAGYNEVSAQGMLRALQYLDDAFVAAVLNVLVNAIRAGLDRIVVTSVIAAALAWYLFRQFGASNEEVAADKKKRTLAWLCLGVVATFLGLFPYLAVARIDMSSDWDSRHQLLVPLGAAFLLVFVAKGVLKRKAKLVAIAVVVACFVTANLATWTAFQRDWYKQLSLVQSFRSSLLVREARHLLIDDRASSLDALRREYRFYEYAGLLHRAFGDEQRLARAKHTIDRIPFESLRPYLNERYRLGQFDARRSAPDTLVVVEIGTYPLSLRNLIALRYYESFDEEKFLERIATVLQLCAAPVESADHVCSKGT